MALPMSTITPYSMTIPSTGKKIKFRPFLIREEKMLLLAQQSEDLEVMVDTLKSMIESCVQDDVDVDSLATFDLEYMFTQIRSKSVEENVELLFRCDTCEDEKAVAKVGIDLTTLNVYKDPNHTNKIPLFDDVGIVMKYPTIEVIKTIQDSEEDDVDAIFDSVVECIDYIYSDDEVFSAKDQTREELMEFLNNLTPGQFDKIRNFFETMPKLKTEVDYNCPVCGTHHHKVLEGLSSFF